MTGRREGPGTECFDELMNEVMALGQRFGHRQHVHLSWLAVRQFGIRDAIALVSQGIRDTARYAGNPHKYHITMSRAWVELVGHHAAATPVDDFDVFVQLVPELLDKRLITLFYSPAALASTAARTGWVPPDRAPLPGPGAACRAVSRRPRRACRRPNARLAVPKPPTRPDKIPDSP